MKFLNYKLMLNILIIMFIVSVIFSALTTVGFASAPPKVGPESLCFGCSYYCGKYPYAIGDICEINGRIGHYYYYYFYKVCPPDCKPVKIGSCYKCWYP
jgi:hypothetical protein